MISVKFPGPKEWRSIMDEQKNSEVVSANASSSNHEDECGNNLPSESTDETDVKVIHIPNERLLRYAAKHRPAQSWYDEDMTGLY
jgi:hypothetical protein